MNLLELVTHLRTAILDDTGGQGVDWTGYSKDDFDSIQLRWSNEELVANINEAINLVYRRIEPVKDSIDFDISSGVYTYVLPDYIIKTLRAKRGDGKEVHEKDINDFWERRGLNTKIGEIEEYFPDITTGFFRVYPIPVLDDTLTLMVYRTPITTLSWDDNEATPELKQLFHLPMLYHAAFRCYLKDEANTLDPRRAATFKQLFDAEFPETSAYSNQRKLRTSNRPVRYGGL
jgi:hypothetical protein